MSDDELKDEGNDEVDDGLAQRFAGLDRIPVPDVWDRVSSPSALDSTVTGSGRRHRMVAVAAAAIIAIVGIVAVVELGKEDGTMSVTTDGPDADGPIASAKGDEAGCNGAATSDRLREGVATLDYEPSASPLDLASEAIVLRGQLVSASTSPGGTLLVVKVRDVVGPNSEALASGSELLIPGAKADGVDGMLEGDFVAFVDAASASAGPLSVLPEGLWIGCGDDGPAEAVLVRPELPEWQAILADGISLGDLWNAAVFGDGGRRSPLKAPLVAGDGTAVFDVGLTTGERFRVSVPEQMAAGLDTLTEPAGNDPIVLEGSAGTVSIAFDSCADLNGMAVNRLGSDVRIDGAVIRFCRPSELISVTVRAEVDLSQGFDAVDVRPIASGSRYGPLIDGLWLGPTHCDICVPWGPIAFPAAGVVVNRTGETSVTAVSLDNLAEVWTVDPDGGTTFLHSGPDGVYVESYGGTFQRLDPATGRVVWSLQRDVGERDTSLTGLGDGMWLLRSSFSSEGDDRAPLLRSIDIATGKVIWTAEGRAGTEWQWSDPVDVGGTVVLMDVTSNPLIAVEVPGGTLQAFGSGTGRLAWTTDLESPTEGFDYGRLSLLDFETDAALIVHTIDNDIVRVNPNTGIVQWRTAVGRAQLNGTDRHDDGMLAISLDDNGRDLLLNPDTGEILANGSDGDQ